MTDSGGSAYNPLTGNTEPDGTSLIDVTNPYHPIFVYHIPSTTGSSSHVAVCNGNILPKGQKGHWYMLRHDGSINQEVWDVTNPSTPYRIKVILSGLNFITTLIAKITDKTGEAPARVAKTPPEPAKP
jgi:hypothetical protein